MVVKLRVVEFLVAKGGGMGSGGGLFGEGSLMAWGLGGRLWLLPPFWMILWGLKDKRNVYGKMYDISGKPWASNHR